MQLQNRMTDDVFFENEKGERSKAYKTKFASETLTIYDEKLVVKDGDIAIQLLPNGTEERFIVTDTKFSSGLKSIPAHYTISIIKESKKHREEKVATNTTFNISNSSVQVGDGNIQNIVDSFNELATKINESESTPEQKAEAQNLLQLLLNNSTVASILKGAFSAVTGIPAQ